MAPLYEIEINGINRDSYSRFVRKVIVPELSLTVMLYLGANGNTDKPLGKTTTYLDGRITTAFPLTAKDISGFKAFISES